MPNADDDHGSSGIRRRRQPADPIGGPRGAGRKAGHTERTWDPDNPWAVKRGVAPVIEPKEEPDFRDPGPGVIGIDR